MKSLNCLTKEVIELLEKNKLLKKLIKSELTEEKIKDTTLKEELIMNIKNSILKEEKLNSEEEYQEWLKQSNMNEKEFFHDLLKPVKINNYALEQYRHQSEARFLKRKNDLDKVSYSLLRVQDSYLATELFLRIKENPNQFAKIASEHSLGEEKSTRGLVGPVSLGKSHPKIQELIKKSKIGEVNKPFIIDNVWIILRVEDMLHSKLNHDMEMLMSVEIFNEAIEKETNEIYEDLKKDNINQIN
tara:strand:+ start:1761 stop:2492 length:732 start_codon:yes stop_codon:yes gene_type:complete